MHDEPVELVLLKERRLAILAEAERFAASKSAADPSPPLPKARAFTPLTDAEWNAIAHLWPVATHALYEPRFLLDAALEVIVFGTPWPYVYGAYGARQFFIRKARARTVQRLADVACSLPEIGPERRAQFEALRTAAEVFAQRRGPTGRVLSTG